MMRFYDDFAVLCFCVMCEFCLFYYKIGIVVKKEDTQL